MKQKLIWPKLAMEEIKTEKYLLWTKHGWRKDTIVLVSKVWKQDGGKQAENTVQES